MKKIISVLLSTIMLLSIGSFSASAAPYPKSATINVTISNQNLELEIAQEPVFVTDLDNDGKLTIDETLICAHNAYYPGGAEAGYKSNGSFIQKLWGVETPSLMYCYNETFPMGADTEVENGGYLHAYLLNDALGFSDSYSSFDINTKNLIQNEELTISLKRNTYDFNTNQNISLPAANASITMNGVDTGIKTDANGKATIKATELGTNMISATSEEYVLVPPTLTLNVSPESANIHLTVVDDNKEFKLTQETINVTDINNDHLLSINDAFICAHNQKFQGGANEGYKEINGFIVKFWGVENGGSYGYYLNNNMAMSLNDLISEGDYIDSFIYSDAANFSDTYTYFETHTAQTNAKENITLKVNMISYDPNVAVEGLSIYINGVKSDKVVDANGEVSLSFDNAGEYEVVAKSDTLNVVPSVCKVSVKGAIIDNNGSDNNNSNNDNNNNITDNAPAQDNNDAIKSPKTGSESFALLFTFTIAALGVILVRVRKQNKYEK